MVQFNLSGDPIANEMISNPAMDISDNITIKQENNDEHTKTVQLALAHALLENATKLIDNVLNQN